MSIPKVETRGPEAGPSLSEVMTDVLAQRRYPELQKSSGRRLALASTIGEAGDGARSAAAAEIIERASNRSPEQVLNAMRGILNTERLGSLTRDGVQLWPADNEHREMREIEKRIKTTSMLRYDPRQKKLNENSRGKTYFEMYQGKVTLRREQLEQDLEFVSNNKRYLAVTGDSPKAEQFQKRAEYFGKYKQILRDLLSATADPQKEMIYLNNHGSVAVDQEIQKHCTDPENAKGALKIFAMGGLALLAAINGVNNFRSGSLSVFTLALLGGIVALKGKDSKYDMLTGTAFTNFCRERLSRSDAEYIFRHRKERLAMIKYFEHKSRTGSEMITQEDIDTLTEKGKGKTPVKKEIATAFLGLPASQAYNHLKGLGRISTDKNKGMALDFIEANHKDGGQTVAELEQIVTRPKATT